MFLVNYIINHRHNCRGVQCGQNNKHLSISATLNSLNSYSTYAYFNFYARKQLDCFTLLLITNRKLYTGSRLPPNLMTLDDLERQNRGFYGFLVILGCETHFKSELHRNQLR